MQYHLWLPVGERRCQVRAHGYAKLAVQATDLTQVTPHFAGIDIHAAD
jgi:hypothetical protein